MSFHTRLGLDVDWANSKSLYVRHLQAGAVEEWNRQSLGETFRGGIAARERLEGHTGGPYFGVCPN